MVMSTLFFVCPFLKCNFGWKEYEFGKVEKSSPENGLSRHSGGLFHLSMSLE